MDFQIFIPPLLGGIIGYITNAIAIKMLFHPRKAIYIGKWRLPMTPGLVPKEKSRIARSIGHTISTKLLNADTLDQVFTSDEMTQKIRAALERFVDNNRDNTNTLEETVLKYVSEESLDSISRDVKHYIASMIHQKLTDYDLGEKISKTVLDSIDDKLKKVPIGLISGFFDEDMKETLAKRVGALINSMILDNSKDIIENLIDNEYDKLKNERVCDVIIKYNEKIPTLIDSIIKGYLLLVKNSLPSIVKGIDIEKIVEEKINSFSVEEFENIIFGVMKKELRAIVWLGALLGFIMGWLNLLILR